MGDRKIHQVGEGKVKPAMTRLKELPETVQTQVLEILVGRTYKEAEPMVKSLVGFFCSSNILCRFRKWHEAREAMKLGDERCRQIKEFLQKEMPEASPEKLRELGVMFRTLVSLGNGDGKEFVNVSRMQVQSEREQIRARKMDLEERKFKWSQQKQVEIALKTLGEYVQNDPEAKGHFDKAREAWDKNHPELRTNTAGFKVPDFEESSKSQVPSSREAPISNLEDPKSNEGERGEVGSVERETSNVRDATTENTENTENTKGEVGKEHRTPMNRDASASNIERPTSNRDVLKSGLQQEESKVHPSSLHFDATSSPQSKVGESTEREEEHRTTKVKEGAKGTYVTDRVADFLRQRALFKCRRENEEMTIEHPTPTGWDASAFNIQRSGG